MKTLQVLISALLLTCLPLTVPAKKDEARYVRQSLGHVCHCQDPNACNPRTGECYSGGCESGWMGPSCQNANAATGGLVIKGQHHHMVNWRDGSRETCQTLSPGIHRMLLVLDRDVMVKLIRLVDRPPVQVHKLEIKGLFLGEAEVNYTTTAHRHCLDISCNPNVSTNKVVISVKAPGPTRVCDVIAQSVSGVGIALRVYTGSETLVDGSSQTCKHAASGTFSTSVYFGGNIALRWIRILTRSKTNGIAEVMNVAAQNSSVQCNFFTYSSAIDIFLKERVYSNLVNITLNLEKRIGICEVQVSGGCQKGKFGSNCSETCSLRCMDSCDPAEGRCLGGCAPGYQGLRCDQDCKAGFYGPSCRVPCSAKCENSVCDPISGKCLRRVSAWTGDVRDKGDDLSDNIDIPSGVGIILTVGLIIIVAIVLSVFVIRSVCWRRASASPAHDIITSPENKTKNQSERCCTFKSSVQNENVENNIDYTYCNAGSKASSTEQLLVNIPGCQEVE